MDNSEEYVLQVFRGAQVMLEGSLMPEHVVKLLKLGEKFAQTSDIQTEAACLKRIEGFSKAGIAFEWLLARAKYDAEFTLEQFDADVNLLFEELYAGFKSESHEPIEWEKTMIQEVAVALPEPDWNKGNSGHAHSVKAPGDVHEAGSPSFTDLLDHPMLLTVRRFADSASAFNLKPAAERATSLAVLKMMAKSVIDMARPQNKVVVSGAFQGIATLIESIERKGVAREANTEQTIIELGQILSAALQDMASGMRYISEITKFITEHKEPGSK
ncbi:MAG TPA: hypothetical protein VK470_13440 [Bacteroidota bacterium]|nr:hypothetical protein [Bacteroidota bacterium]